MRFPRWSRVQHLHVIQQWSAGLLRTMGMELYQERHWHTQLSVESNPLLLISNHVSWLDILVIQAIYPCYFVAKVEVKKWPVLGRLIQGCGVIFVDRSSTNSAHKMVDEVSKLLRQGYAVAGFPEGTSSQGYAVSHFHANLFEAAISCEALVQPLALRYVNPQSGVLCEAAAFVGDMGFAKSLHGVLRQPSTLINVSIGDSISPLGHSRKSLAQLCQQTVSKQLVEMRASSP